MSKSAVPKNKQENSGNKTSTSASLTMLKPLTVDHNKLLKIVRDVNTRQPYLAPEKSA